MKINAQTHLKTRPESQTLVVPYFRLKGEGICPAFIGNSIDKLFVEPIECGDFKAKSGELFTYYSGKIKEKRAVLLGLGDYSKITIESVRVSFSKLVRHLQAKSLDEVNLVMPSCDRLTERSMLKGVLEGLLLTNYVFEKLKSKSTVTLLKKCNLLKLSKVNHDLIQKEIDICEGVNLARDLVNGNADFVNANKLCDVALSFDKKFKKIKTTILKKSALEREKLNLILKVNQASSIGPALIIVDYKGDPKSKEKTVILGKGVTYDSGGLQIKPRVGNIVNMKSDMGGAAAVLGTLLALAKLDLKLNIVGVIAACENAVGPTSYKPGDVIESYSGKTVEITNTDAEGRLVLADAISYAKEKLKPTQMVDMATLTGGVIAALGDRVSGLMSNDDHISEQIVTAGQKSGEPVWRLPLVEEYSKALHSDIADLANSSNKPGYAAAIIAGLFLKEFAQDTPWAHLDIAGTSYMSSPRDYHQSKSSGVGVRLMIAFLEELMDSIE